MSATTIILDFQEAHLLKHVEVAEILCEYIERQGDPGTLADYLAQVEGEWADDVARWRAADT